ncbi:uncharacterized protein LOC125497096 [Beta vulgaris subsp. vulgaris]|uniref:uncharacterized protein LOC125497096 n=1 Tax=Beta vulgaris subsp. vulgaris TaxID=3555 RepID=UPI0020369624|nr:uncharacterized protein LOC125497096 [Beta vulgaris subsp. vulgaris]XP_048499700.1 uncharacterized protein LOC125497096 [Beta vulgaris subsp. vulgaris]
MREKVRERGSRLKSLKIKKNRKPSPLHFPQIDFQKFLVTQFAKSLLRLTIIISIIPVFVGCNGIYLTKIFIIHTRRFPQFGVINSQKKILSSKRKNCSLSDFPHLNSSSVQISLHVIVDGIKEFFFLPFKFKVGFLARVLRVSGFSAVDAWIGFFYAFRSSLLLINGARVGAGVFLSKDFGVLVSVLSEPKLPFFGVKVSGKLQLLVFIVILQWKLELAAMVWHYIVLLLSSTSNYLFYAIIMLFNNIRSLFKTCQLLGKICRNSLCLHYKNLLFSKNSDLGYRSYWTGIFHSILGPRSYWNGEKWFCHHVPKEGLDYFVHQKV